MVHCTVITIAPPTGHSDLDDLFDVQKELIPVSAKWRSIGIALRLKPNILDGIETRYSGDPPACLTSTVTEWLNKNYNVKRFGEPTWQALVEAVGDPAGGANMALARDMARRHQAGGMSCRWIHCYSRVGRFTRYRFLIVYFHACKAHT